jgi:hypothetical protein
VNEGEESASNLMVSSSMVMGSRGSPFGMSIRAQDRPSVDLTDRADWEELELMLA